jgi:hypothetical protein
MLLRIVLHMADNPFAASDPADGTVTHGTRRVIGITVVVLICALLGSAVIDLVTTALVRPSPRAYLRIEPTFGAHTTWTKDLTFSWPLAPAGTSDSWQTVDPPGSAAYVQVKAASDHSVLLAKLDMRVSAGRRPNGEDWLTGAKLSDSVVNPQAHDANDVVGWQDGDCAPTGPPACGVYQFVVRYADVIVVVRTGPLNREYLSQTAALQYLSGVTDAIDSHVHLCEVCV